MRTFTIVPSGAFSLRESAEFGFGQRAAERFDGVLRLAFCADGSYRPVGVEIRQDTAGVHVGVHGDDVRPEVVRAQVARILSLDHDLGALDGIADRDPVIARLLQMAPGLLPPLFHSPYEGAVWAVLGARRPAAQAMQVRRRLSETHGRVFDLAGRPVAALPGPGRLQQVTAFPGIPAETLARLHGVARAAEAGRLDAARLRTSGPVVARADLLHLKGIGPFHADLLTLRAVGFVDELPTDEPILREAVGRLYGLGHAASVAELEQIARAWHPRRTWCAVLVRAASQRVSA
jgi:DNA-3-methyladenine glycosylase II